jgi:hypothetical protein
MTLGQIENTMAMICNGRKVLWQGWVLSFDWAEGYLATKDNLSVACFDSLPDLLHSMKRIRRGRSMTMMDEQDLVDRIRRTVDENCIAWTHEDWEGSDKSVSFRKRFDEIYNRFKDKLIKELP